MFRNVLHSLISIKHQTLNLGKAHIIVRSLHFLMLQRTILHFVAHVPIAHYVVMSSTKGPSS